MAGKPLSLRPLYVAGAAAVLVLAGASISYAETASVHITVPPQRIETHITVNLANAPGLTTRRIESHVTDIAQGAATGTTTIAPAYATGSVRLRDACSVAPPLPYTLPAGTVVWTNRNVRFLTQSPVTFTACNQTQPVGIHAVAPGSAGNQPPGAIIWIQNGPLAFNVVNDQATTGGVDGGPAAVVQQSDIDAVRTSLTTRVTNDLNALMSSDAAGMNYAVEGQPTMQITSDHSAGDQASSFTVTMTGTLVGYTLSYQDGEAIIRGAMQPIVWPGYELADRIDASWTTVQGSGATVSADAVGYAVPKLSAANLRSQLAGLPMSAADWRIRHQFPGSSVEIRSTPLQLPWLPVRSENINVTLTVQQSAS